MAQNAKEKNDHNKKSTGAGNFLLAIIFGIAAGFFVTLAEISQKSDLLNPAFLFLAVSIVSTFEVGLKRFIISLLGNMVGMGFFILLAQIGKGPVSAMQILTVCLETLAMTLVIVAVAVITLLIGASILSSIYDRVFKKNVANGNP